METAEGQVSVLGKARGWLVSNRTSVRLAFILRIVGMGAGSLLSLWWTRLLLRAMGDDLNGLFLSFAAVTRLGGLGDLGISGAIALKAGQMLGRGQDKQLQHLLASARTLFLALAVALFLAFALPSPWLPAWLHFQSVPGAGSLPWLFVWGGVSVALVVLAGYFHSLNYAHGTVTWPVLPTILIGQVMAPFAHWLLARAQAPLWLQNVPYVASTLLLGVLAWRMLKWSHPWLGSLLPLSFDRGLWKQMAGTSWWVYLSTLGNAIYFTTDRIVINAKFGPGIIPTYQNNYKACELAMTLIVTAGFVSLPKITQWLASTNPNDHQRMLREVKRLNTFEIFLGCAAALGYLALNDIFVRIWLGPGYEAPLAWQFAFAANLAVTTAGDAGINVSTRCGENGMRAAGVAIGLTGLLNLGLSVLSVQHGSITGVAVATVVAQSLLSLSLGWYTCKALGFSQGRWILKNLLLPLAAVAAAYGVRKAIVPDSVGGMTVVVACYAAMLVPVAILAGLNRETLREEFALLRGLARK